MTRNWQGWDKMSLKDVATECPGCGKRRPLGVYECPECLAHDYGCECQRCDAMFKAITAEDENGEYFFSDDELLELATRRNG